MEIQRWLEQYLPNSVITDLGPYDCSRIKDLMLFRLDYHCNNNNIINLRLYVFSFYNLYVVNIDKLDDCNYI